MSTVSAASFGFSTLSGRLLGVSLENTINIDYFWLVVLSEQLEVIHE